MPDATIVSMSFPDKNINSIEAFLEGYTNEIIDGLKSIDLNELEGIIEVLDQCIKSEGIIYTCGNGGSSAIADHFVCDFLKGAATDTNVQPIIHSLSSNMPTITAVANDISYEDVFSHQVEKYGIAQDVLICVSSSGNSPNIIKAIKFAKKKGMHTISFVGFNGGKAKKLADHCIHIPIDNYGVVEDIHHSLMHMLAQYIRLKNLGNKGNIDNTIF